MLKEIVTGNNKGKNGTTPTNGAAHRHLDVIETPTDGAAISDYEIVLYADADPVQLGGKAAALAAMQQAGIQSPHWFVVSPQALQACLSPAQRQSLGAARSSETVQAVVASIELTPPVRQALVQAITPLGGEGTLYAVRSSALDEDSSDRSFAGQLESFLNVPAGEVFQRVVDVWRSGFTARVYTYRREHGLRLPPPAPAVII